MLMRIETIYNISIFATTSLVPTVVTRGGLQACNVIRKGLQHRCFQMNIVRFLTYLEEF